MKIKYEVPRGLRPENQKRAKPYHWWLVEEAPRKMSRLSQLNKANTRVRTDRGLYRGPKVEVLP